LWCVCVGSTTSDDKSGDEKSDDDQDDDSRPMTQEELRARMKKKIAGQQQPVIKLT
jgi:hypothetical protein